MKKEVNSNSKAKSTLHPNNIHRTGYDFEGLVAVVPELKSQLTRSKSGATTIDFSNSLSVKLLNKALLISHYNIRYWTIPEGYLCPPVPGRADYLHHISDIMADYNNGSVPKGEKIRCLDIGVGANCIYPIIIRKLFNWTVIGSEIDSLALKNAKSIISQNKALNKKVELRQQKNKRQILKGIFSTDEYIDVVISNPPFYANQKEAVTAKKRKTTNLNSYKGEAPANNFGGQQNELWCEGGEKWFISQMIQDSIALSRNCFLFTSLLSNKKYENELLAKLKKAKATIGITIPMQQGNKTSRILCWTFLTPKQQKVWARAKWS